MLRGHHSKTTPAIFGPLNEKETLVLRLLADGLEPKEIAARCNIKRTTVIDTTARIRAKLNAKNTINAVALYFKDQLSALRHQVIQAAYKPGPMCRDCADRDGTCSDGTKCDPFEAALDVLREHAK